MDYDSIKLSQGAYWCFAGFFNGAINPAYVLVPEDDGLSVGKAECEWDWRKNWAELQAAGLMTYTVVPVRCRDNKEILHVYWQITPAGSKYREEDLRRFNEQLGRWEDAKPST